MVALICSFQKKTFHRTVALALLSAAVGCGNSSPTVPVFPTKGEVFVGSQPAVGARVIFHPLGDASAAQWPSGFPRATVGKDGGYTLETYGIEDGAPAGKYAVIIYWPEPSSEDQRDSGDAPTYATPPPLVGQFDTFEVTHLRAEVKSQPTQIERFNLR